MIQKKHREKRSLNILSNKFEYELSTFISLTESTYFHRYLSAQVEEEANNIPEILWTDTLFDGKCKCEMCRRSIWIQMVSALKW